jgi:hypothetical protein
MECKFIKHGMAIAYDHVVKPCCAWKVDNDWKTNNHISITNLDAWHQSQPVILARQQLDRDVWPERCFKCKNLEQQSRSDSMRGNGNHAYSHYSKDDITLEIRPGNTCNFACQTCWPEASSRVAQYHHQAGLIDIKEIDSTGMKTFDFLVPIKDRIRDIVLLGGEPFYDKSCRRFLSWAMDNVEANIMMFTNGSCIDYEFIEKFPGKICLIFSLDATGSPAEYIRFGTVWAEVLDNYRKCSDLPNVEIRVNITTSVFNYFYLDDLIDLLCQRWPSVVSFGITHQPWFLEDTLPITSREMALGTLSKTLTRIRETDIETGQKHNAINAIDSIMNNLRTKPWNQDLFHQLKDYVCRMDLVKGISMRDYCPLLDRMLEIEI